MFNCRALFTVSFFACVLSVNFPVDPLVVGNFHGNLGRLIYNKFETGLRNERLNTTNGRQDRADGQPDKETSRATVRQNLQPNLGLYWA